MSQKSFVAGVDCSTQATKVVVVDETGELVATGRAPHAVDGRNGARESDPEGWLQALRDALAETGMAPEIDAIAIAAQQHGLVVTDGDGAPLRPAILWNDTRASDQSRQLVEDLGGREAAVAAIGSLPGPAFTVSSWIWLREKEPRLAAAAGRVSLPHDWLTERLVGRLVSDRGDASTTGWWSASTGDYVEEVLNLGSVSLTRSMLPEILGANDVAGCVEPDAANALGLRPGIPVGVGTGDNPATALAAGAPDGSPVISLGTSGTVFATSTVPASDPSGTLLGLADASGKYLPLVCTLNCTTAVDQVADWLGLSRMDAAASSAGLVMLPYLDGERTPNYPLGAGSITGLRHTHTRQEILRAAYEGAAFSLVEALSLVSTHASHESDNAPIMLVGGGAANPIWQDCLADLSGRAIAVVDIKELAAFGAAIQARAVLDGASVTECAHEWLHSPAVTREARPANTKRIARIREILQLLDPLNRAAAFT